MPASHGRGRVAGYKLNYCAYAMLHALVYTHLTHTHSNNKRQTTCGPLTANSNYIYTPLPSQLQSFAPFRFPPHLPLRCPRNDRFIICLIA